MIGMVRWNALVTMAVAVMSGKVVIGPHNTVFHPHAASHIWLLKDGDKDLSNNVEREIRSKFDQDTKLFDDLNDKKCQAHETLEGEEEKTPGVPGEKTVCSRILKGTPRVRCQQPSINKNFCEHQMSLLFLLSLWSPGQKKRPLSSYFAGHSEGGWGHRVAPKVFTSPLIIRILQPGVEKQICAFEVKRVCPFGESDSTSGLSALSVLSHAVVCTSLPRIFLGRTVFREQGMFVEAPSSEEPSPLQVQTIGNRFREKVKIIELNKKNPTPAMPRTLSFVFSPASHSL